MCPELVQHIFSAGVSVRNVELLIYMHLVDLDFVCQLLWTVWSTVQKYASPAVIFEFHAVVKCVNTIVLLFFRVGIITDYVSCEKMLKGSQIQWFCVQMTFVSLFFSYYHFFTFLIAVTLFQAY